MNATDLARRLENLIRLGTVAEVDLAQALCRVQSGALLSNWLPWLCQRAGQDRSWDAPSVGEQCLLLAPSGELASAIVLPALYSQRFAPPDASASRHRRSYADGAVLDYDSAAHHLNLSLPAGASLTLSASGGLSINGDISLNGDLTVTGQITARGDVKAAEISLIDHIHGGVQGGQSTTGAAQ